MVFHRLHVPHKNELWHLEFQPRQCRQTIAPAPFSPCYRVVVVVLVATGRIVMAGLRRKKNRTDNRNVKIINVNYRHLLCYFYVLHTYGKDKMPFSIYIYIFFESPGKKSWPWQTRAREDG